MRVLTVQQPEPPKRAFKPFLGQMRACAGLQASGRSGVHGATPAAKAGSGAGARWPEQAVKNGAGHGGVMEHTGGRRPQRQEESARRDQEFDRHAEVIRQQVLRRLVRLVQVIRPILMVMVGLLLQVKRSVLKVSQRIHRRSDTRQRNRLPKHGKQHDEEDDGAAHATVYRGCRQPVDGQGFELGLPPHPALKTFARPPCPITASEAVFECGGRILRTVVTVAAAATSVTSARATQWRTSRHAK